MQQQRPRLAHLYGGADHDAGTGHDHNGGADHDAGTDHDHNGGADHDANDGANNDHDANDAGTGHGADHGNADTGCRSIHYRRFFGEEGT